MKRKYLLPIIAIGIVTCMSLTACSSDNKNTANETSVSNEGSAEDSAKNDKNKSSEKDNNNSTGEDDKVNGSKNSTSSENSSTNSKSSKSKKNDTSSSKADRDTAKSSSTLESKTLSKTEAVNKILAKEFSGQSVPKYHIPVTAAGDGYSALKKTEGSDAFLCNDDNKLDNGVLVELVNFNGENDSNSFAIRDYNAMKNGGRGMVDKGSISKSGEVTLG